MGMINEQALFKSVITRMFNGLAQEILGELLQNAQRAGANCVTISFPAAGTCVIEDDGHGLIHGQDDLRKLLVFAESYYPDGRVKVNQNPMGVGLYALIAHEAVANITIESGSLAFTIETRQWINDPEYRETWEERVLFVQCGAVPGLRLSIEGGEALMEAIRASCALRPTFYALTRTPQDFAANYNPVSGYAEILMVLLDGARITALLPKELTLPEAPIVTTYRGNEVRISPIDDEIRSLVVNWYGKIILDQRRTGFCAYLEVRAGQPVTPQAPTRTSLVQNTDLDALYRWVEDQIFAWVDAQPAPEPWAVKRLYAINRERALRECPFAVLRQWTPLEPTYQFESYSDYAYGSPWEKERGQATDQLGGEMVVRKGDLDALLLLDEEVICPLRGDHSAQSYQARRAVEQDPSKAEEIFPVRFEIGLNSFLPALGVAAYHAVVGCDPEHIRSLWWRPGPMEDAYHTTELGEWAIGPVADHGMVALEWKSLAADQVFVAKEPGGWSIEDAGWIIGLPTTDGMVGFLRRCGWAPFVADEDREDDSVSSYASSIDEVIVSYLKDTIDRGTALIHLPQAVQHFLPPGYDAACASWSYLCDPQHDESRLTGVRLSFMDGYVKDVHFYRG